MAAKLTQAEFLAKCFDVHGDRYSYENAIYRGIDRKVDITCPVHGSFLQKPHAHTYCAAGCPKCGAEMSLAARTISQEEFIDKCKQVHPEYDYTNTVYQGSHSPITVRCNEHGEFTIIAAIFLRGPGCKKCSKRAASNKLRSNKEEFALTAEKVHGQRYDYSEVVYKSRQQKVDIKCREHGVFPQTPTNHLGGAGCPKCQKRGYNVGKPSYFYIFTSDNIVKVGITSRKPETRAKEVSKRSGRSFAVHTSFYSVEGRTPLNAETACHKYLRERYEQLPESFDGSTECFLDVDMDELIKFLIPIATTQS